MGLLGWSKEDEGDLVYGWTEDTRVEQRGLSQCSSKVMVMPTVTCPGGDKELASEYISTHCSRAEGLALKNTHIPQLN